MAEEIWIFEDEPIRVSYGTKGYIFYKGGSGILGSPIEAQLRLVSVKGAERIELPSVADLKGRVVIESCEEALEFVRLFTSTDTHYLFSGIHYIESTLADNSPGLGEYTEAYKQRMNLEPPSCRQKGDVYIIERNLADRAGKLFRATERVGRDGDYSLLKSAIIDEHSPVTYPIYQ
jgi:hypothetical protein